MDVTADIQATEKVSKSTDTDLADIPTADLFLTCFLTSSHFYILVYVPEFGLGGQFELF